MLSKSRFVAGWQCHKLLWWKVHEPGATELQPGKVLQDLFDQGRQVGEIARRQFPGGVLIDLPHHAYDARVAATRAALAAGVPAIFEASFIHDDTFVAIDVLERVAGGHRLIEVKSSSDVKEQHIPDVAVQAHVAVANGVILAGTEVMHLNKEFRHPATGDLLTRSDVVPEVIRMAQLVPEELERQQQMLAGPLPQVEIGGHCLEPYECPFMSRCWPAAPDHISTLYNVGAKRLPVYLQRGITAIGDLPANEKLNPIQKRQIKALTESRLIVEPTLAAALAPFSSPRLGFLDFETIQRAVPVWPGMKPWEQAAAQFSYHEQQGDGTYKHTAFLAEGPEDARPPLAAALVRATAHADRVVMYTTFERTRIRALQVTVPELRAELLALEEKLLDLRPPVKEHVYHPAFRGSFSLKDILSPLVPELSYDDLVIVDGRLASVEIARLLFVADKIPAHERARVRQDLLDYCERDTWATVRLLEELKRLAGVS